MVFKEVVKYVPDIVGLKIVTAGDTLQLASEVINAYDSIFPKWVNNGRIDEVFSLGYR